MRSLKFHYIRAEDILCFGPQGIELHFTDHGQVVQVIGINYDNPGTEDEPASNAAGKSSLQELLSIGLYGRTVKSPTKNKGSQIINCLAKKGRIEIQWDDFRVVRTFKRTKNTITGTLELWQSPNHIWDDESKVTQTSTPTQDLIEREIGLTHHAFCNVVIFDDSNTYSFLEANAENKRKIVENLLDLDQYRAYHDSCKDFLKDLKRLVEKLTNEYSAAQSAVDICTHRIKSVQVQETNWCSTKQREVSDIETRILDKQRKLDASDTGKQLAAWQQSQDRILTAADEISDLESKKTKLSEVITVAKQKVETIRTNRSQTNELMQQHRLAIIELQNELEREQKVIYSLQNFRDGTVCSHCFGIINRQNYGDTLINAQSSVEKCLNSINGENVAIQEKQAILDKKTESIKTLEGKILEGNSKIASLDAMISKLRKEIVQLNQVTKPEGNVIEQVLEAEIIELKRQLKGKQEELAGGSPYQEIITQAETEKAQKETEKESKGKELQEVEAELPYYQYWLEAFGDNGIRKFVVDGIIPALNARIAYWLQVLIEGKMELTFDNTLEETITRNGNPVSYYMVSNGEKRRINLAVSQAFAYVMMLNSGTCPSIVFLDEITGGGIDRAGIPGVYNMIFELAKERQVFVTTHNEYLMGLLNGCEAVTLKKRDDITTLAA